MNIKDIEQIAPVSRGSTEIFKTGQWGSGKPYYLEKTSPCRQACPAGIDMARALAAAALGRFDEALRIVRQDNPLPGVCGRVCYHPCEKECNRQDFDEAVNIRGFERYLSDHGRVDLEREAPADLKKDRVAIIGSGPAGLSAAWQLARQGYPVTIFEALPEPGGMLRYGIPEYRLPKEVLRQEIGFIRQLGVAIQTGVRVGRDVSLQKIKKDWQALFIAAGVQGSRRLGIEGEGLPGVKEGIPFLRGINRGESLEVGRRVAIIGGGNTAMDCARTARRLGGEEVTVVYWRSRTEMPALAEETASLEREGIRLLLQAAPKRLLAEGGRLSGLECLKMDLGAPDDSGRSRPLPIAGSEFILPVDTVITAVGQVPEAEFVGEIGLSLDVTGLITVDLETRETNVKGVFAGGDLAGERAFVADAVAGGKRAALAIACFLEGRDFHKELERLRIGSRQSIAFGPFLDPERNRADLRRVVPFEKINTLCFPWAGRRSNPERPAPERRPRTFEALSGGLDPAEMNGEISRCFKCGTCVHCDLCFLLCPDVSIQRIGWEGYRVNPDYCKGCGQCAATCPRQVIEMEGPA
jgi:NADPH-dependent glutamate synthase beta subunit-like oxidoreductase/NAD-dependent dihydropyrimidine dehydrogenase PreA subunit